VIETARAYQQCVAESLGRNDCGEEFADLDLAQACYERAVADYHNLPVNAREHRFTPMLVAGGIGFKALPSAGSYAARW
jgi:hypothetical protein